jgi:hypothetical protein
MISLLLIIIAFNSIYSQVFQNAFSDDSYKFAWSINEKEQTITFTLDVATTGWIGLGFSKDGKMLNADLIMCYINKSNQAQCSDRFANSYMTPPTDVSLGGKDDLINISGSIMSGRTMINFTRKMNTGDKWDYIIKKDESVNVLFAYREAGNPDTENGQFGQHSKITGKSLILFGSTKTEPDAFKTDSKVWRAKVEIGNYTIPDEKTTYVCRLFDMNKMIQKKTNLTEDITYHAIAFEPKIINAARVHHIIIYSCNLNNLEGLPTDVFDCSRMNFGCETIIYGWAPGVSTTYLPEEAGIVLGTYDTRYVNLEIHYDNPEKLSGQVDQTGIDIWYTTKLRKYDAGYMILGNFHGMMTIPKGQQAYEITDSCSAPCTASGNINIISYSPHAHRFARKITTTVIKADGTVDSTTLVDNNYDFNMQRSNTINPPMTLSPGWKAITNCTYNTLNSNNDVQGGESTDEEMCYNFVLFYPRENGLSVCIDSILAFGGCKPYEKISRVVSSSWLNYSYLLLSLVFILLFDN